MNFQELYRKIEAIDKGQLTEESKADKDYDGDGEVESEKDEVWGSRMKAADKNKEEKVDEEVVDECGMMGGMENMPSGMMGQPKQQDSVTMNVSMNGAGAGGIRDLLNVLKDIQDGDEGHAEPDADNMGGPSDHDADNMGGDDMGMGADTLLKKNIDSMAGAIDDDFANGAPGDPGPKIGSMGMMTHDGDDLHKEKRAYPKAADGDNAMQLKGEQTFTLPKGDLKIKLENLYNNIKSR